MGRHDKTVHTIAFIIDGLGMGGAERLMMPILDHLDKNRFNVRVCVLQSKDGNPLTKDILTLGVKVDLMGIRRLRDPSSLSRLQKYLKNEQVNLVHTQLEFANVLGNISAKLLHLPSVSTVHVLPPAGGSIKNKLHQWVEWLALRLFCDHVITVSEETRRHYIAQSGIPSEKLSTIYNGIDPDRFRRLEFGLERIAVREEFHIPLDANLLTTIAVLRPQKGIEYMIRALPTVLESHPNTYYLIAGDGSHRDILAAETENLGVRDRVIFAGTRRDVPQLLAASDVFVLPTLTEALPTVLAEAMASHVPIVASAVGGVPEMVVNDKNGKLVSPAKPAELSDACNTLLNSPEVRRSMGEFGWQVVNQKFNINNQVNQLQNLYLEQIHRYGK